MAKRKHISLKTKLASALLELGHIPYADAKEMGEANFLSLWTFDHGILHGVEVNNSFWNLTPRLIVPHREKSRKDAGVVAKVKRLEKAHAAHIERMTQLVFKAQLAFERIHTGNGNFEYTRTTQRPKFKRKIPSRPFPKRKK